MRKLYVFLLCIVICFSWSCKKDEPKPTPTLQEQMPPRTEIGARKLVAIVSDEYIFESNQLGFQKC